MTRIRIVLAVLALTLAAAAPAGAQGVLRIGLNDDPDAIDPTISRAYVGRLVFAAVCDKLFDVTPDLRIVPQLATGYEWAADTSSLLIKLRPGVKFHDGEPLNGEAVKFNIERHINTPGSFRKSEIGEIKTVEVVNDLTVRLHLSQPLVPLLAALTDRAGMMVSPKAAKELGDKFGTRPVCAGPFKFVERVAQGKIVFERFADYWDKGNIHLDRVEFVPILDSTARSASLRSGDLHMIERVSPADLEQLRADSRLKVTGVPELGYQVIRLNVNNGPRGEAARRRRAPAPGHRSRHRPRDAGEGGVQQRVHPGQPVGEPERARTTTRSSRCGSATSRGPSSSCARRASPTSPSRSSCRRSATARRRPRSSRPCSPRPASP